LWREAHFPRSAGPDALTSQSGPAIPRKLQMCTSHLWQEAVVNEGDQDASLTPPTLS
jgi:hypothetical protein